MRFAQIASIAALASTSAAQVVVIGGEGGLCLDLDSPGCGQGGKPKPSSDGGSIGGSKTSSTPASSAKPSSSGGWGHSSSVPAKSSSVPVTYTTIVHTAYTTYCPVRIP